MRYRATTPNWGDPAVPAGRPPTAGSDRYLLAITFLRVVGAAHFPIQGHQKSGQKVNVDLELPRTWRKLPDMPGLWELCERSLSLVNAADRPLPAEWVVQLEELLGVLSAGDLAASVRQAQGDPRPATAPAANRRPALESPSVTVPDVAVRPVLRHRAPSTWRLISAGEPLGVGGEVLPGIVGGRRSAGMSPAGVGGGTSAAERCPGAVDPPPDGGPGDGDLGSRPSGGGAMAPHPGPAGVRCPPASGRPRARCGGWLRRRVRHRHDHQPLDRLVTPRRPRS